MENKQNLHTHSVYCDGDDTLEELTLEAIKKGFSSLGFSGHSYMYFREGIGMKEEDVPLYKKEIAQLKEKYKGTIDLYCGLEYEYFSEVDLSGYDYIIGSCHYLYMNDYPRGIDRKQNEVKTVIEEYFDGDGLKYAKKYYETLATLPTRGKFDILGHFDIVTKHLDNVEFFDENSKEYKSAAVEALEALKGKIPFFELNTGAISRGYKKSPYPSPFLIKEMKRLGFGAVISSDCHNKEFLDCYFEESRELLKECGFKERYIFTDSGFKAVEI